MVTIPTCRLSKSAHRADEAAATDVNSLSPTLYPRNKRTDLLVRSIGTHRGQTPYLVKLSLPIIKKRTAPLVWLLAGMLLLFPVSAHALPGIVLCIESDGRIEIESSRSGDCASRIFTMEQEVHTGYAAPEVDEAPRTTCPTSCIDMLLFASPADGQAASTLKQAPQKILYPAATPPFVPSLETVTPPALTAESAASLPPLTPLRTVVLLI